METTMKKVLFIGLVALPCFAENYLLDGGQSSRIAYRMEQHLVPATATTTLILSYVIPQTFRSPSYSQEIRAFELTFSDEPYSKERILDKRGNVVIKATWRRPRRPINAVISFEAINRTELEPVEALAPFPPNNLPNRVRVYLEATRQVPSTNSQIVSKARQLTKSSVTEFDAVQQILTWIVDHMTYVQRPVSYDALYSWRTGKGNCQNYSHMAAAMMRAVGIPVRIVNGITLKESYDVQVKGGMLTMRMAEGRHSWIEVYFPGLSWVPFDPQQTQLFVSNRFIRVEVGMDNNETVADGTVRWSQSRGFRGRPKFKEQINASFISDEVNLLAERQPYGPRKMLFSPPVEASFSRVAFEEASVPPIVDISQNLASLTFDEPSVFGNLDFPENVDFLDIERPIEETEDSLMVMHKSFLVETSEYVTTKGQKYAQTFILEDPLKLVKIGAALHKFGGEGQLWIELSKDDGTGKPGEYIANSDLVPLDGMPYSTGYDWVDFTFTKEETLLSPGRYWIALGYTGSPIVNWFFTYGKPVGPADGTRYNTMFDETWSHSLAYEFNYRVIGMKGK
jgi:hypothetical protein